MKNYNQHQFRDIDTNCCISNDNTGKTSRSLKILMYCTRELWNYAVTRSKVGHQMASTLWERPIYQLTNASIYKKHQPCQLSFLYVKPTWFNLKLINWKKINIGHFMSMLFVVYLCFLFCVCLLLKWCHVLTIWNLILIH